MNIFFFSQFIIALFPRSYISSVLYIESCSNMIGFVFFVMTLKPGSYAYQFTQFCWTHMTLLLVVFQAHFIVNSIFEGLIWFFLPVCLVITNDIFAYICGMIWGRTPLIRLSPKKTVEGFIGGWICTIIIGGGIAYVLTKFKYMICPVTVYTFNIIANRRTSEYRHGQV
jgi:phosphatidate cytidylyltransferase